MEYSNRLWEAIRMATFVLDKMPSIEVPQGAESVVISLESGDPTWYKVAQTTAEDSTDLRPVRTCHPLDRVVGDPEAARAAAAAVAAQAAGR